MKNTRFFVSFSLLLVILGIVSIYFTQNWWLVGLLWVIRTLINGVIAHRYIAHRQFSVHRTLHNAFAYLTSLSAYSTPLYWRVEHLHHHATSDTIHDIHSPINGKANSFLLWSFNVNRINAVFKNKKSVRILKELKQDKHIRYASDYFVLINVFFLTLLFFIDINLFFAWNIGYLLEHIKIGVINWLLHEPRFPGNYRNHNTTDQSFNNVFLGLVTFGFGWHNNHHANSKKLILTENWWEVDIEGQIGRLIERAFPLRS